MLRPSIIDSTVRLHADLFTVGRIKPYVYWIQQVNNLKTL